MIGWRAWRFHGDRLGSVSHRVIWNGPTLRADVCPTEHNTHGIYALTVMDPRYEGYGAWGEVALSGTVVVGTDGYRAEVATIRSMHVRQRIEEVEPDGITPPGTYGEWPSKELVKALEDRYQVTVTVDEAQPTTCMSDYTYSGHSAASVSPYASQFNALLSQLASQQANQQQALWGSGLGGIYGIQQHP